MEAGGVQLPRAVQLLISSNILLNIFLLDQGNEDVTLGVIRTNDVFRELRSHSICIEKGDLGGVLEGTSQSSMKENNTKRTCAALSQNHEATVIFQQLNIAKFSRKEVSRGTNDLWRQDWLRVNSKIKVGGQGMEFPTNTLQSMGTGWKLLCFLHKLVLVFPAPAVGSWSFC